MSVISHLSLVDLKSCFSTRVWVLGLRDYTLTLSILFNMRLTLMLSLILSSIVSNSVAFPYCTSIINSHIQLYTPADFATQLARWRRALRKSSRPMMWTLRRLELAIEFEKEVGRLSGPEVHTLALTILKARRRTPLVQRTYYSLRYETWIGDYRPYIHTIFHVFRNRSSDSFYRDGNLPGSN